MTDNDLEKAVLQFVVDADTPCSMVDIVNVLPVGENVARSLVRSLLNRGVLRLTLDWRVVADRKHFSPLEWSQFEHRDNPISNAADAIRMAISYLDIDDAFVAVKRVYDEMRGVILDGGAVHDTGTEDLKRREAR